MTVFLIIVAVLAVIIAVILSISATVTIVYDKKWSTKINVLFIEKEISLSEILSFVMFPEKKAKEVSEKNEKKNKGNKNKKTADKQVSESEVKSQTVDDEIKDLPNTPNENAPKKSNPIKQIWDKDGIVGIMDLLSNLLDTANNAVLTLIRGLHIYSLYVMILVGGGDADFIARSYGTLCKYYYPLKGLILSSMKVDNYDDYIQPDFIADNTDFEFQLIASINVGLLLKVGLKAAFIFVKNLIKNKKTLKKGDK